MDDILDLAGRLGKAIADSKQAQSLRQAREALHNEPATVQLLNEYQAQAHKIGQLEEQQKPVEVGDKHTLNDLHDRLIASETFKKYTAAQVDYIDLMRRVNDTLRHHLGETEKD